MLISHANKVTLKILQAGFKYMWTKNLEMYKVDLGKSNKTRDQIANSHQIIEKAR